MWPLTRRVFGLAFQPQVDQAQQPRLRVSDAVGRLISLRLMTIEIVTHARCCIAILVSVADAPVKAIRINITLPEPDLTEIDRYAKAHGLTRSGFLLRAAKHEMGVDEPA